jgi:MinD-like ATPase involved in chromosome partitioning or flagellar assembly
VSVPVLTAVTDAVREADLVSAFERTDYGVSVVRRCVDLADLLSTAAGGTARAVILSADLRRLDRDALARLATAGVAVVALVNPADDDAERRLRQLGVRHVLAVTAGPQAISAAVTASVADGLVADIDSLHLGYADPRAALPQLTATEDAATAATAAAAAAEDAEELSPESPCEGRLVAVWGPTGAPGRTTLAVTLATEAARLGVNTLLADADVYGAVIAQALGLLDESPGLAAAVRQANAGNLDVIALAKLARVVSPQLRVLTGIARADRWPELRPSGLSAVYALARRLAALTVVDCGFCLEQDEELSYDTAAPRRNGATLATLAEADHVVAVGTADPVGLQRLVRGLTELAEVLPDCRPHVVVNRVRKGPINGEPKEQIAQALSRYAGVENVTFVPYDQAGFDRAIAGGRSIAEVASDSPARLAMLPLVAQVAGLGSTSVGRRRKSRQLLRHAR